MKSSLISDELFIRLVGLSPYKQSKLSLRYLPGLFHHASKHYQRVLDNTERRMKDDPTVSIQAYTIITHVLVTIDVGYWIKPRGSI